MAVAQSMRVCAPTLCRTETSAPRVKDGALFTLSTVMLNICVALEFAPPPSSTAVTETVAKPGVSPARVKVSVPSGATAGWVEKSGFAVLVTMKLSVCPVSPAPAEKLVAQFEIVFAPVSSPMEMFAPLTNVGAMFGCTVIVNVCATPVSIPPPAMPPSS